MFPLIETGWNLPCKQVLRIMKRLRHGKHLSMISFLPTQCMIFSIRFVVQSVKDFHPCNSIRKAATSTKSKAAGLPPYRLMFILSNADSTAAAERFFYSNLCIELFRQRQVYPESCYILRKTKAAGLPPYRLMFIFSQRRRHDCRRAFSLPESVRQIAPPMRIDSHHAILSEKLLHLMQNKSGTASTHTA